MNHQEELNVQAYLDNELDPSARREVEAWLRQDPEAQSLHQSLDLVRRITRENEPLTAVPESREFYWSKIERAILAESPSRTTPAAAWSLRQWISRVVLPLGAAASLVGVVLTQLGGEKSPERAYLHEMELPLDEMQSMSFYAPTEGMTVVWVQTRGN